MKPCLKLKNNSSSPTPRLCTHRKCVAFGAQISEEVHVADEWDRTPTEPTRRLTYQDILELKEIQRSLPHANQPCEFTGGRQFLSQVPIALVPLLPQPVHCTHHLLDTPPSSGSCSPYSSSSRTSSPPPSLDSSPRSSPSPNPFLPLLLDDPDPHPLFPTTKLKRKKFIIVNDIEIEMDDSDSDSCPDNNNPPRKRPTPTPPSTPTQEKDLDLDPPSSILFSPVNPSSRDTNPPPLSDLPSEKPPRLLLSYPPSPSQPPRLPKSPSSPSTPTLLPSSSPPPTAPKLIGKPHSPTSPPINLHIPMRFKRPRSGSCLTSGAGAGAPTLRALRGV